MVTKRIMLLGGNGQVGKALQRQQIPSDWHMGVYTRATCDFTRPGAIGKAVQDFAPDLVINAAAMTGIDQCEKDRDLAMEVNFHAVANLAAQCVARDAPLIQLSTDYVFDGANATPYLPDDAMNPLNAYGQSKMLGEEAARHGSYWHIILRTSLVFSAEDGNVLTRTLRQIDEGEDITAITDQKENPTSAHSIAAALVKIAEAVLGGKGDGFGTFHLCDQPAVTRHEFAQAIMEAYAPFTKQRPGLTGVRGAELPGRVPRPACTMLNCDKIHAIYGIQPRPWRDDLAAAVKQYAGQHS